MAITLQFKGGTENEWNTKNPVLAEREIGLVLDDSNNTIGFKVGNGEQPWNDLPNFIPGQDLINAVSTTLNSHINDYVITNRKINNLSSEVTRKTTELSNDINTLLEDSGISLNDSIIIKTDTDTDLKQFIVKISSDGINIGNKHRDHVISEGSIAIGSDIDIKSNNLSSIVIGNASCVSGIAPESIVIGNNAIASGAGAVQIGPGENSKNNSLQFKNQTIIQDNIIDPDLLKRSAINAKTLNVSVNHAKTANTAVSATYALNLAKNVLDNIDNIIKNEFKSVGITTNDNTHAIGIGKNTDVGIWGNIVIGYNSKTADNSWRNISIGESANVDSNVSSSIQLGTGTVKTNNTLQYYICPIVTANDISKINTYRINPNLLKLSLSDLGSVIPNLSAQYSTKASTANSAISSTYLGGQTLQQILDRYVDYYNNNEVFVTELGEGIRKENSNEFNNRYANNLINIGNNDVSNSTSSIVIGQHNKLTGNNSNNIAIGVGAEVSGVSNSVQLGKGINKTNNSLQFNDCIIITKDNNTYKLSSALIQNSIRGLTITLNALSSNIINTPTINSTDIKSTDIIVNDLSAAKAQIGSITIVNNALSSTTPIQIKATENIVKSSTLPEYYGAYLYPENETVMRFADVKWYLEKEGISLAKEALTLPQDPSIIIGKDAIASPYNVVIAPHGSIRNSENSILIATPNTTSPKKSTNLYNTKNVIQLGKSSSDISSAVGKVRVYDTEILTAPYINGKVNTAKFTLSKAVLKNITPDYVSAAGNINITTVSALNSNTVSGMTVENIHDAVTADVPIRYTDNSFRIANDGTLETPIQDSIVIGNNNKTTGNSIILGNNINSGANNTIINAISSTQIDITGNNNIAINAKESPDIYATTYINKTVILNSEIPSDINDGDVVINDEKLMYKENDITYLNKDLVNRSQVHYPVSAASSIKIITDTDDEGNETTEEIPINSLLVGKDISNVIGYKDQILIGNNIRYQIISSSDTSETLDTTQENYINQNNVIAIGNNIELDNNIESPLIYLGTTNMGNEVPINLKVFGKDIISSNILNEDILVNSVNSYYNINKGVNPEDPSIIEVQAPTWSVLSSQYTVNALSSEHAISTLSSEHAISADYAVSTDFVVSTKYADWSVSSDKAVSAISAQYLTQPFTLTLNGVINSDSVEVTGAGNDIVLTTILDQELLNTVSSVSSKVLTDGTFRKINENIILSADNNIIVSDNRSAPLIVSAGQSSLELSSNGPQFKLIAGNSELIGNDISSTLTWNNKNITLSVNGISADETGNISISSVYEAVSAKGLTSAAQQDFIDNRIKVYPPENQLIDGSGYKSLAIGYNASAANMINNIVLTTYPNIDDTDISATGSIILNNISSVNYLSSVETNTFNINGTTILYDISSETPILNSNLLKDFALHTDEDGVIIGSIDNIEGINNSIVISDSTISAGQLSSTNAIIIGSKITSKNNQYLNSIALGNNISINSQLSNSILIGNDIEPSANLDNSVVLGNENVSSLYVGSTNVISAGRLNTKLLGDIINTNSLSAIDNNIECIKTVNMGNYHTVFGYFTIISSNNNFSISSLMGKSDTNIPEDINIQLTPYKSSVTYEINNGLITLSDDSTNNIRVDYSIQWVDD